MSSNNLLITLFVVVMIGLVGGIIYMTIHPRTRNNTVTTVVHPSIPIALSPTPLSTNSSDAQLQIDSQSIDDSLNAISSELSNADQGLNDQQVVLQ